MRNWPLFQPPKPPIVIDFFGWKEDPWEKAIKERAESGWARVIWTRPYIEIPAEPSPVPFRYSILFNAVSDVILKRPIFVRPYYRETSFDLDDYGPSPRTLKRFFELWVNYISDVDVS